MAPPIPEELAWLILHWYLDLEWNAKTCAELSLRSESSVYRILGQYRKYGTVTSLRRAPGRSRILSTDDKIYVLSLLKARPHLYLDEIQLALYETRHVDVSVATISRTLKASLITNKKIAQEALEKNEQHRAIWQATWGQEDPHRFMWLDESGSNDRTSHRQHGWAPLGRYCVERLPFTHGTKLSTLPILTTDGIVDVEVYEGAVNKERFISFIRNRVAPLLNPYIPGAVLPRSIVVCDNCSIHHDEEIRRIIVDECGAKLCYLPAYSPDFNPIEEAFSYMKAWLRRHDTTVIKSEARPYLIHQALMSITPEHAHGWITNCGYSYTASQRQIKLQFFRNKSDIIASSLQLSMTDR